MQTKLERVKKVVPSRDNSRCPFCGAHGYRELPWKPAGYYDPLMKKVRCLNCGGDSYIGPKLKHQFVNNNLQLTKDYISGTTIKEGL